MNRYVILAGTPVMRRDNSVPGWERVITSKEVTYDEADVQTHGTKDISYVFRLPDSAKPFSSLAVAPEHVGVLPL